MLATLFYVANWHFIATDASYFASFLGASPLRHTWSLAIEEQYYLIWPLVLLGILALVKGRRAIALGALIVAIVGSTAFMAAKYDPSFPSRTYFGTFAHAAPLLVGSALAVLLDMYPGLLTGARVTRVAQWLGPLALAGVLAAIVALNDSGAFYYHGALLFFALIVAVALWALEAAPHAVPARVLSLRPVVWVGVISYGLYLWHWPLLLWIGESQAYTLHTAALVVGASFGAAALSFYLVERPIRSQRVPGIRSSGRRLALAFSVLFLLIGSAALAAPTLNHTSALAAQVDSPAAAPCPQGSPGFPNPASSVEFAWCESMSPRDPAAPVVASIGDSTSMALSPGLEDVARDRGWGYVQAGQSNCSVLPMAFSSDPSDPEGVALSHACANNVDKVLDDVRHDFDPNIWVISDHVLSFDGLSPDDDVLQPGSPELNRLIASELHARLTQLTANGDQVVLMEILPLGPPVECAGEPNADCDYQPMSREAANANAILRRVAARVPGVVVVSVKDIICPDGECLVDLNGTLIRYDGTHFTDRFSRIIGPIIMDRAERAGLNP
jgi:hypothetical protein